MPLTPRKRRPTKKRVPAKGGRATKRSKAPAKRKPLKRKTATKRRAPAKTKKRSPPKRSFPAKKRRLPKREREKTAAKKRGKPVRPRKTAPKRAPSAKQRAAAKRRAQHPKGVSFGARSSAAKKGWEKRRKRARLLAEMSEQMLAKEEEVQPLGWTERRQQLRLIDDTIWRKVVVEYDPALVNKRRLEILKELNMDLLSRDDLYDHLKWASDHYDIELSDMYRMYLGYGVGDPYAEPID